MFITNFRRLAFASHSVNLGKSIPLNFDNNLMNSGKNYQKKCSKNKILILKIEF